MHVMLSLDRQANTPIFQQIIQQIISLIDRKALNPGDHLPPTRSLARSLGVNRSTVYRAYQELWSLGYVESRPGSYSTVRKRMNTAGDAAKGRGGAINWRERINPNLAKVRAKRAAEEDAARRAFQTGHINFIPLMPDSSLFPLADFRSCMNRVLSSRGLELLSYGDPRGFQPLRSYIARRMQRHSVWVDEQEIIITSGAQNALDLILRLLAGPGSSVALEAPTYSRALDIVRLNDLRVLEIPMNERGMDLDLLEEALPGQRVALVYTIPNFHNPTGISTDQAHRERLLTLCTKYEVPLVEDGFEEEMKYFGKVVLPIKSMDKNGLVFYLGTFSKVLFPGLRVGWIAANRECVEQLADIQKTLFLSGNLLDQAALERFCSRGYYRQHLKRMHHTYRSRMQAAFSAIKKYTARKEVVWSLPRGGYTLWVRLMNLRKSEDEVLECFMRHGVSLLPGSTHFHGKADGLFFRLSIAVLDEEAIEEGVRRLGLAISKLYES